LTTTTSSSSSHHDVHLEDTLRVVELIRRFRSRGHLVAQLDPLRRTPGGPWLGPIGDEYSRADYTLTQLVGSYPYDGSPDKQSAFIAQQIGLQGPTNAGRRFDVGSRMPGECHHLVTHLVAVV
jgi:hypothetical protein